ncbi:hypothetical protein Tco_0844300 [Tanacetum coccineum]
MVINSPCLTDKKELAIPGQTTTGKESSNPTRISNLLITSVLMANMEFCDKHNMVAYLQKPTGSEEFHEIVDFLAGSHISMKLNELTDLCTKLVDRVTTLENELTQTKQGRMKDKEHEEVETKDVEVEYDLDQQVDQTGQDTPTKATQCGRQRHGSMIRYQALKKKPVTIAQATKNMKIYLKNMAGYKMTNFKGMRYEQIRPIFEKEYNKVQTLFQKNPEVGNTRKEGIQRSTTPGKL